MKIRRERPERKVPFEQRPIKVDGHRLTYGVIRHNAEEMLKELEMLGAPQPWEKGITMCVLALLDELERCQG